MGREYSFQSFDGRRGRFKCEVLETKEEIKDQEYTF